MGMPSTPASNALIYVTYALFLVIGIVIAWRLHLSSTKSFLSNNGTQKGIPLALNFIASALGSGILFTYPQIATICGVQGVIIYAFSSALPLLVFGYIGPKMRERGFDGFVLTEWARQRYGIITCLFLSVFTLLTLFLYMVAELSALQQVVNTLTGLNGLPPVIVQCVICAIYTSIGGFRVSFITDNIQGVMVLGLIIISVICVGVETDIDRSLIDSTGLTKPSLLGWQLLYILPIALVTNYFFISGYWLRTFSSRTNRDLRIGVSLATVAVFCILTLVGVSGLLSAWSGAWDPTNPESGALALFLLLGKLPGWVVGIVLVFVITLSTAAFDSLVSGMVSNASNDLFRNRVPLWSVRIAVFVIMVPVVVVALKSPDILTVYLISDLVSASVVPPLVIGLFSRAYAWRGFEVVVGGLGGLFTVFLFGLVYYSGDAKKAGELLLLQGGLYANDWSVFGAFVAAPVGGLLWSGAAFALRIGAHWVISKKNGTPFTALDRPVEVTTVDRSSSISNENVDHEDHSGSLPSKVGKFF